MNERTGTMVERQREERKPKGAFNGNPPLPSVTHSLSPLSLHPRPLVSTSSRVKDEAWLSVPTWCPLLFLSIAATVTCRETVRSLIVRLSAHGPISRVAILTLDAAFDLSPVLYGVREINAERAIYS